MFKEVTVNIYIYVAFLVMVANYLLQSQCNIHIYVHVCSRLVATKDNGRHKIIYKPMMLWCMLAIHRCRQEDDAQEKVSWHPLYTAPERLQDFTHTSELITKTITKTLPCNNCDWIKIPNWWVACGHDTALTSEVNWNLWVMYIATHFSHQIDQIATMDLWL